MIPLNNPLRREALFCPVLHAMFHHIDQGILSPEQAMAAALLTLSQGRTALLKRITDLMAERPVYGLPKDDKCFPS